MSTYPLRLPEHVMDEVRQAASEDNVSLNQLLTALVADGIGHRRAIMALKGRAARGDANAALAILDRVANIDPDPTDALDTIEPRSGRKG